MNARLAFPPTLVRASAGTGKTYELSNRFIALLACGEKPERILATTFTRKAAGEVRERVMRRLAAAALDPREAARLGEAIGKKISCTEAGNLLQAVLKNQHRLNICTLDSFFFSIACSFGCTARIR